MPDIIGKTIDRLCMVDVSNRGMPHDFLTKPYDAARVLVDDRPISFVAAERLVAILSKGDVVLVLTGAGLKPILPESENAGGLEAAHCSTNFLVDGLEGERSMAVVQLLGNIVRRNLEPPSRGLAR